MDLPSEIRITVAAVEFYAFVRGLKRGFHSSDVGAVVLSLREKSLTIETKLCSQRRPRREAGEVGCSRRSTRH